MKNRFKIFAVLALATVSSGTVYAKNTAPTFAVSTANRPAEDVARDAIRKPSEMVKFAMIKPGQTVVDMLPGGGYFTRVFSQAVGPEGKVIALVSDAYAKINPKCRSRHPEPEQCRPGRDRRCRLDRTKLS